MAIVTYTSDSKSISQYLSFYDIKIPSVGKKYIRFVPGTFFTSHASNIFYFCEGYCTAAVLATGEIHLFGNIKKIDTSSSTVSDLNLFKFKKDDGIERFECFTLS